MGPRDIERNCIREIISGKLYFAVLHKPEDLKASWLPGPAICFSIDDELVYEPFYADFGPLNLACTYRFCWKLNGLLKEGETHRRCVCFCCCCDIKKKPNAAVLLGAYLVLFEGWDAEPAYAPLTDFEPYFPFRDPTCGISTYHLSVLDCIRVENGDLNWIVPNKLVAFSGPGARPSEICGYRTLVPEDYVEYFKQSGVSAVIRLNKRLYDKRRFTEHGFSHYDLYFPDGSCPPERIVQRFLEIVEGSPGAVAVHCKAGLGRTGVLIGCYLMKHFRFTSNEVIGYLRIVRPGSVIGPQQHFLRDMQSRMWKAGDAMRRQKSDTNRNNKHHLSSSVQSTTPASSVSLGSTLASPLSAVSITGTGWSPSKGGYVMTQNSINPIIRRVNTRTLDNFSKNGRNRSPSSALFSDVSLTSKDRRPRHNEEEAYNGCKPNIYGEALNMHTSVCQHLSRSSLSRGSNGSISNGSVLFNVDSMASCSNHSQKPLSNGAYNTRACTMLSSSNNFDNTGILRNTNTDCKHQSGEGICTQRTVNAAGQPRKVVVPVCQAGKRDCSPGRRRSGSPSRNIIS
eukprot:c28198_g1_i2 orf=1171-2874(-)